MKEQYKNLLRKLKSSIKKGSDTGYYICNLITGVELYEHFLNVRNNLQSLYPEIYSEALRKMRNVKGDDFKYSAFTPFLKDETELRIKLLESIIKDLS